MPKKLSIRHSNNTSINTACNRVKNDNCKNLFGIMNKKEKFAANSNENKRDN